MALDPTRRTGTHDGREAVSVSVAWLQETLNAALSGRAVPLVVDGVWGANTQGALGQYVVTVLGTDERTTYNVLAVDPSVRPNRVLLTPALEASLAGTSGAPPREEPRAGGGAGLAIGLMALGGAFLAWKASGKGSSYRRGMRGLGGDDEDDAILERAREAERRLATIARTRRPTEAETAEARVAYAAAARVQRKRRGGMRGLGGDDEAARMRAAAYEREIFRERPRQDDMPGVERDLDSYERKRNAARILRAARAGTDASLTSAQVREAARVIAMPGPGGEGMDAARAKRIAKEYAAERKRAGLGGLGEWYRVPTRDFRTKADAQKWIDERGAESKSHLRVQMTRPPGWGMDGKPRYGVFTSQSIWDRGNLGAIRYREEDMRPADDLDDALDEAEAALQRHDPARVDAARHAFRRYDDAKYEGMRPTNKQKARYLRLWEEFRIANTRVTGRLR